MSSRWDALRPNANGEEVAKPRSTATQHRFSSGDTRSSYRPSNGQRQRQATIRSVGARQSHGSRQEENNRPFRRAASDFSMRETSLSADLYRPPFRRRNRTGEEISFRRGASEAESKLIEHVRKFRRSIQRHHQQQQSNGHPPQSKETINLVQTIETFIIEASEILFGVEAAREWMAMDRECNQEARCRIETSIDKVIIGEILVLCFDTVDIIMSPSGQNWTKQRENYLALISILHFVSTIIHSSRNSNEETDLALSFSDSDSHRSVLILAKLLRQVFTSFSNFSYINRASERPCPADDETVAMQNDVRFTIASSLCCLSLFIELYGHRLMAEKLAHDLMNSSLLPIFDITARIHANQTTELNREPKEWTNVSLCALECLHNLFQSKPHASAILSPLVLQVEDEGEETVRDNPLGAHAMDSLQRLFLLCYEYNDEAVLISACRCLCQAQNAVLLLQRSNSKRTTPDISSAHLNIPSVAKQIQTLMRPHSSPDDADYKKIQNLPNGRSIRFYALRLLSLLAQTHSNQIAAQWALFLEDSVDSASTLGSLQNTQPRGLQVLIASGPSLGLECNPVPHMERMEGVNAMKELLKSMPLQRWFMQPTRLTTANHRGGHGNLAIRVRNALRCLIRTVYRTLLSHSSEPVEYTANLCTLVISIVTLIPFEEDDGLVDSAADLLKTTANLLVDESSDKSHDNAVLASASANTIISCTGGTAQNGLQPQLLLPTQVWLSCSASEAFLGKLLSLAAATLLESEKNGPQHGSDPVSVIGSIVRVAPWTVMWERTVKLFFQQLVCQKMESNVESVRMTAINLAALFLEGRSTFGFECVKEEMTAHNSFVVDVLCPRLQDLLKDPSAPIRSRAAVAHGFLLGPDWKQLLLHSQNAFEHNGANERQLFPLKALLQCCVNSSPCQSRADEGESSGLVRSDACKSVGSMCSVCIDNFSTRYQESEIPREIRQEICTLVADVMLCAAKDRDASVRSMAMFALGNLGLAVKECTDLISEGSLFQLCSAVYRSLDDANDKVVGNAIRTIGHLSNALYCQFPDQSPPSTLLCGKIMANLSLKLTAVMDYETGIFGSKLTWKQRSNAKKHAWGACRSLSFLIPVKAAMNPVNHDALQEALDCLFRSVLLAELLHEKVVLSATSTLKMTPVSTWQCSVGVCGCLGSGVANILAFLHERHNQEQKQFVNKVDAAIRDLLGKLLFVVTELNDNHFLQKEVVTSNVIEFLYNFMVDRGFGSTEFAKIANGLQPSSLEDDAGMCQKFTSRAKLEHRKEEKEVETVVLSQSDNTYDFGDDEL